MTCIFPRYELSALNTQGAVDGETPECGGREGQAGLCRVISGRLGAGKRRQGLSPGTHWGPGREEDPAEGAEKDR